MDEQYAYFTPCFWEPKTSTNKKFETSSLKRFFHKLKDKVPAFTICSHTLIHCKLYSLHKTLPDFSPSVEEKTIRKSITDDLHAHIFFFAKALPQWESITTDYTFVHNTKEAARNPVCRIFKNLFVVRHVQN